MELLCGVLDALPFPAALLNPEGLLACVNSVPCPVNLEEVDFPAIEMTRLALQGKHSPAERMELTGVPRSRGLAECRPVFGADSVLGALFIFRPEFITEGVTADALPTAEPIMDSLWERLRRLSLLASPVLVLGESGCRRSDFARALHNMSARRGKPFASVTGSPEGIDLAAALTEAGEGTLLCADADKWLRRDQLALLSLLDNKGHTEPGGVFVPKQCRIVATARPDSEGTLKEGALPQELWEWFRSSVVLIPPLRDRRLDIIPAAEAYRRYYSQALGKDVQGFSPDAREALERTIWPENLKSLRHMVESAVSACPGGLILVSHLPPARSSGAHKKKNLNAAKSAFIREQITALLEVYGQSVEAKRRAAAELGIGLSSLYRLMSRHADE
jgi:DNA-binding NtrC family response regulator